MLFSWNIPPSPSSTESKRLFRVSFNNPSALKRQSWWLGREWVVRFEEISQHIFTYELTNLRVNKGEMIFLSLMCILATVTEIHSRQTLELQNVRWRQGENWLLSSQVVMPSWVEKGPMTSYFLHVRPGNSWHDFLPAIQALDLFLIIWDLMDFRATNFRANNFRATILEQTQQWHNEPLSFLH